MLTLEWQALYQVSTWFSSFKITFIYLLSFSVSMCACMYASHSVGAAVKGQLEGLDFPVPLCVIPGIELGLLGLETGAFLTS